MEVFKAMKKIKEILIGIGSYLLVGERINTQRCNFDDIDTTKTILDYKGK